MRYFADDRVIKMTSRMSEEGLWAKLKSTGMTPPLYLHKSSFPGARVDSSYQSWERRAKDVASSIFGSVDRYDSEDPEQGFFELLLQKNPGIEVDRIRIARDEIEGCTSSPPLSTIREIGIRPRRYSGVVPLMEHVLPRSCPKLAVSWMQRCIEDPPKPYIARHIQAICRGLTRTACSIPTLHARLPPSVIVEVRNLFRLALCRGCCAQGIEEQKTSVYFLDSLRQILTGIAEFVADPEAQEIATSLLTVVVEREMHHPFKTDQFLPDCRSCISAISKVLTIVISDCLVEISSIDAEE